MRYFLILFIDRVKLELIKRAFFFCKGVDSCKDMVIYYYFLFFIEFLIMELKNRKLCFFMLIIIIVISIYVFILFV